MADDSGFGPHLADTFDFTMVFEHAILSILPSGLFLSAAFVRLWVLAGRPVQVRSGALLWGKLAVALVLLCLQITAVGLWASEPVSYRRIAVASSVLGVLDALACGLLVWAEHRRSKRPSWLLSLYLFLSVLIDVAQARSLWLRGGLEKMAGVFVSTVAAKSILLFAEEIPRTKLLKHDSKSEPLSPEDLGGIFNSTLFWWLNPLFTQGYKIVVGVKDLPVLHHDLHSEQLLAQLATQWAKDTKTNRHCLLWTTAWTFRVQIFAAIIPRLAFGAVNLTQPFLLQRVVALIDEPSVEFHQSVVGGLVGATALVYVGIAFTRAIYKHLTFQLVTMVRGALVSMIFRKTLELKLESVVDSAPVTLMSTDIDGIQRGLQFVHDIWASVLAVGVGLYILQNLLGYSAFLVVVPSFLCTTATHFLSKSMAPAMADWNRAVQKRVGDSSMMLSQMKGIKMMGLSDFMFDSIQGLRVYELDLSKRFRWVQSAVATVEIELGNALRLIMMCDGGVKDMPVTMRLSAFFQTTDLVFHRQPATTIALVSPIAVIIAAVYLSGKGGLGIPQAFTALGIMVLITEPLALVLASWPILRASVACFDRIQAFLLLESYHDFRLFLSGHDLASSSNGKRGSQRRSSERQTTIHSDVEPAPLPAERRSYLTMANGQSTIEMQELCFKIENGNEILHDVSIKVPHGQLTMIVGPVGCGKSSLLRAMLGELSPSSGNLDIRTHLVAYCDQAPWLRNTTIRENIIGESGYPQEDKEWYARVVQSCDLHRDLSALPSGDETRVGSGGVSLSGGQKQRVASIALARAVYSRKQLVIVDDCFSGLDNRTAAAVFDNLFGTNGLLKEQSVTAIVATHSMKLARKADFVTVLRDGRVQYNQFNPNDIDPSVWGDLEDQQVSSDADVGTDTSDQQVDNGNQNSGIKRPPTDQREFEEGLDMKRTGDKTLYLFYAKSIGFTFCFLWILFSVFYVGGSTAPQVWLRFWTQRGMNSESQTGFYAAVYAVLSLSGVLGAAAAIGFFLVIIIPKSAQDLHRMLLKHVLEAPFYFFVQTDSGTILNRFSQDMTQIDQVLPIAAVQTGFAALGVLARLGLVASGASYVAIAFPFVFAALWILQRCYLRTSRQIRHLDLECKAPLYTAFTETLAGLATVRAFAWQDFLMQRHLKLLDTSQRAYYLMFCLQRWLNLVLDLFAAGLAVVLVGVALNLPGGTSKGAVGLAMLNLIDLNTNLNSLVMSWTNLEISLGALSRLKSFMERTPQESGEDENYQREPPGWPTLGEVVFENVTATYSPGSEPVLRTLSLVIKPGQKVAICGRTGSGKSSLILTLLRMLELREGTVRIDGVDISVVPRQTVRRCLTTLPQDPVTLSGTVRQNLDPERVFVPDCPDLEAALIKVGVWDVVSERGGLEADFNSMGFSTGQKQLFCLARAALHRSKVVLLDECTSGIDHTTNLRIRDFVSEDFKHSTVVEVLHRMEAVTGYDVVVVMRDGKIAETGDPTELLSSQDSLLRRLWEGKGQ